MTVYIKALLLIALLFLAITFGTQNSEPVTLRYYFGLASPPVPLYLIVYLMIILGVIVGMAIDVYSRVTLKRSVKKLEKANVSLRQELETLRSEAGEAVKEESEMIPAEPEVTETQDLPPSSDQPENEEESEVESTIPEPLPTREGPEARDSEDKQQ